MKLLLACSLIALVACQCCLGTLQTGLAAATDIDGASKSLESLELEAKEYNQNVRVNFKLPKMFNFELFKSAFNKHYASALEEMARIKLFMANAYRAFVSAVKYKYRKASYYLAVNSRSDWTAEELEQSKMKPGTYRTQDSVELRQEENKDGDQEQLADLIAEPEEIEAELKRIEQHANEPGYSELATELKGQSGQQRQHEASSNSRKKRAAEPAAAAVRRNFNIDQAFNRADAPTTASTRLSSTVPKERNPNYVGPELASQMSAEEREKQISIEELAKQPSFRRIREIVTYSYEGKPRDYSTLPVKSNYWLKNTNLIQLTSSFVGKMYSRASDTVFDQFGFAVEEDEDELAVEYANADVVWADHRQSGCLFPVQNQLRCGSCYAFAATAFLEWAYCKETGSKTKFSEQYVVDCGKFMYGLNGCDGGRIDIIATFMNNFGLELERNYPYKAREEMCGYPEEVPMVSRGYVRLNMLSFESVPTSLFEEYLISTPLVISIATNGDFVQYGGGVWDGANCGTKGDHAMLLIGHGREDGEEYWLIRNSYGEDYGESGHLKLNKNSDCIRPREGLVYGYLYNNKVRLGASINSKAAAAPLITSKKRSISETIASDSTTATQNASSKRIKF